MKAIILAGGIGTRLSEETTRIPKPMVEIGDKPIIWHIMKLYSYYGIDDFIICCGYKGYLIKEYFFNYFMHNSDITIDLKNNDTRFHNCKADKWTITIVDTGENTMTGSRLLSVKEYIGNETFCMTYGDGLSDVDISELILYHKKEKKLATVTAVQSAGRFGSLDIEDNNDITEFKEKPIDNNSWINGGFFVLDPKIFSYIKDNKDNINSTIIFEREPLENLAKDNQLKAYKHKGFWKPMDTLRDKSELNGMWTYKQAPWKVWND
jgi:glucose-1-phosphate cytidylyltransferase